MPRFSTILSFRHSLQSWQKTKIWGFRSSSSSASSMVQSLKIFFPSASFVTLTEPHFPVGWMASSCPFKIHRLTVFSCTLNKPETSFMLRGSGDSSNLVFRSFMAFLSNGFKSFDSDCTVNRFARLIILDDDLIHFLLLGISHSSVMVSKVS